ncbi:HEPN domain-containing protein [Aeromonas rivipollensis]|mgnify:FL=1|uniref:HEPN domain-containing protein n=2 Tax=Aeromonadaceae TaxID=84642 RepID=UPI003D24872F
MKVGSFRRQVNVSQEYLALARSDEVAAEKLSQVDCYRQACYFIIQSMEKYIRAKIFSLVRADVKYFRDENRNHSLDSAIDFLIKVISSDSIIQQQVSKQLAEYVLVNTKYNHLHNNLRYPAYFSKSDSYYILDVGREDYQTLFNRLSSLKHFLNDINKLS